MAESSYLFFCCGDLVAVAVVGLDTRLGCLDPKMSPDSDAQKMIDATNYSFEAFFELTFAVPIWKYIKTPMIRKLFNAQDVITEYISSDSITFLTCSNTNQKPSFYVLVFLIGLLSNISTRP